MLYMIYLYIHKFKINLIDTMLDLLLIKSYECLRRLIAIVVLAKPNTK